MKDVMKFTISQENLIGINVGKFKTPKVLYLLLLGLSVLSSQARDRIPAKVFPKEPQAIQKEVKVQAIKSTPDDQKPRIYLGVILGNISDALRSHLKLRKNTGLLVEGTLDQSPAAKAGILKFDILTHLDDQLLINRDQLVSLLSTYEKGSKAQLKLIRKGKASELAITLDERKFDNQIPNQILNLDIDEDLDVIIKEHISGLNKNINSDLIFRGDLPSKLNLQLDITPDTPLKDVIAAIEAAGIKDLPISISQSKDFRVHKTDGKKSFTLESKKGMHHLTVEDKNSNKIYKFESKDMKDLMDKIPADIRDDVRSFLNSQELKALQQSGARRSISRKIKNSTNSSSTRTRISSDSPLDQSAASKSSYKRAIINKSDDRTIHYTVTDGVGTLKVQDRDGKTIFDGPVKDIQEVMDQLPEEHKTAVLKFLENQL